MQEDDGQNFLVFHNDVVCFIKGNIAETCFKFVTLLPYTTMTNFNMVILDQSRLYKHIPAMFYGHVTRVSGSLLIQLMVYADSHRDNNNLLHQRQPIHAQSMKSFDFAKVDSGFRNQEYCGDCLWMDSHSHKMNVR